ncbi:hypothetical protein AAFP30_22350 [Gordonia sp. CPCC 205515]|uniref:hypothetical protein n=1 Tax=Gordonia sp. CPCC 205515 TaxID=3140791 RepID=UPI003AF3A5E8
MSSTDATIDSIQTVAELEERIRNGDTTITPAMLDDAERAEKWVRLQDEAAARAQQHAQAAESVAATEQLHADFARLGGADSTAARKAYAKLVAAVAELHTELDAVAHQRTELSRRAADLDIVLQLDDLGRVAALTSDEYVGYAIREAAGDYLGGLNNPHALHSDKQVAASAERQEAAAAAEEARRAKEFENSESVVDVGFGNYRRIHV